MVLQSSEGRVSQTHHVKGWRRRREKAFRRRAARAMELVCCMKSCSFRRSREAFFCVEEPAQRLGKRRSVVRPRAPWLRQIDTVTAEGGGVLRTWVGSSNLGNRPFGGPGEAPMEAGVRRRMSTAVLLLAGSLTSASRADDSLPDLPTDAQAERTKALVAAGRFGRFFSAFSCPWSAPTASSPASSDSTRFSSPTTAATPPRSWRRRCR